MVKKIALIFVLSILTFGLILTPKADAATPDQVVNIAKKYLGVRYQWGGTTPSGFDCSGFVRYVFAKAGVSLPRTAAQQYGVGTPVSTSQLRKGDLVYFQTYKPGPSHSGIYIGDGKFISATSSSGVTIDSIYNTYYWGPRYFGAKRVIERPDLPNGEFYDVSQGHFAYDAIHHLSLKGIIKGYAHSEFKPAQEITRAQAAVLLARALDLPLKGVDDSFVDVSTQTFGGDAIIAVHHANIIDGFSDDSFKPGHLLTRAQMAKIIDIAYSLESKPGIQPFNDVPSDYWASDYIMDLKANGISNGHRDGTFHPGEQITRAEFSALLYRAIQIQ